MNRLWVVFVMILLVFGTGDALLHARGKNTAVLNGSINGKKARFLSGEVTMAGSSPYLLVSLLHQGDHWMLDIKGVTSRPGKSRFSFYAMERKNRKLVASYNGAADLMVQKVRKKPQWLGSKVNLVLKSRSGKKVRLSGVLYWNRSALPVADTGGRVKLTMGNIRVGPEKVKIKPWNNGVRIEKLFMVRPGETVTMMLDFPSTKDGRYTGSMTIMHFRMVNGKMVSGFLKSKKILVQVSDKRISFSGTVSNRDESRKIEGVFSP